MATYRVERSTTIDADPATVHALIDDFREWQSWSPWEGLDPDMERTFSGAESGVGAHYAWRGNKKAGAGSMEITRSAPEGIDIDLRFLKPFKSQSGIGFALRPAGARTEVTWSMTGEVNGLMRVFTLVKPMDSLVGPDFEKGLAQLKVRAEG